VGGREVGDVTIVFIYKIIKQFIFMKNKKKMFVSEINDKRSVGLFKTLIFGVIVIFIFRNILRMIVNFALYEGYHLGGMWNYLATITMRIGKDDLFLDMDYAILASVMILFFSLIREKYSRYIGINKLAILLFLGAIIYVFLGNFLDIQDVRMLIFEVSTIIFVGALSFVAWTSILMEEKNIEWSADKKNTSRKLAELCLQSKGFRLLLSLVLWILLFGVALAKLLNMPHATELMGVYEMLACVSVSLISFVLLSIGVVLATRKVKKSILSIIAMMVVISILLLFYIMFFFSLIGYVG